MSHYFLKKWVICHKQILLLFFFFKQLLAVCTVVYCELWIISSLCSIIDTVAQNWIL